MSRRVLFFFVAALLFATAAPASAALKFGKPCNGGNLPCATLKVPLDRSGEVDGEIALSVQRLRARGSEGAVFALAGGPGEAGSSAAELFNRVTFKAIGRRDLVIVDQRGTGGSGALKCPALDKLGDKRPFDVRVAECAERLGERRGFYTTPDTVADLEAVRAELGLEQITLLGVSYGTKVALQYAATYPDRVERLVLDSAVAPEGQSPFDLDTFAAMPRIFGEVCRAECEGVTDDLAADVAALVDQMREGSLRGTVITPRGKERTVNVTPRDLYVTLRVGDLIDSLRSEYPGAIRAALEGDEAPLLRLVRGPELGDTQPVGSQSAAEVLSPTLQAATLCEEAPLPWERDAAPAQRAAAARSAAAAIDFTAFEPFDRETVLAEDVGSLLFGCRRWPTTPQRTPPATLDAMPDVPVLLLSGREDLRTPLEVAQRVGAAFPQAQLVEVPKTGHSVLASATTCTKAVLRRFMAGASAADACVDVKRTARVQQPPPARLADVPGGSAAKRVRAAARLALTDALLPAALGAKRGGGLRAGFFVVRRKALLLRGFSFVPGVTVTGSIALTDAPSGELRVAGSAVKRPFKLRFVDGELS